MDYEHYRKEIPDWVGVLIKEIVSEEHLGLSELKKSILVEVGYSKEEFITIFEKIKRKERYFTIDYEFEINAVNFTVRRKSLNDFE